MANNCYFEMKIAGEEKAVEEFVQMLKWQGPFKNSGLGRVFSFDIQPDNTEKDPNGGPYIAVTGYGDCAWSVKSSMRDNGYCNLEDQVERLGLAVEVYSSEPGLRFQEHLMVIKDETVFDECVDYEEHLIEGAEEKYIQELLKEKGMTREELMSQVNCNGDFCIGGFDDFGDFDDLLSRIIPERKPALDAVINDAVSRSAEHDNSVRESEHENVRE